VSGGPVEQADAADEPHGVWMRALSRAGLHLMSGSQLIRGVRRTLEPRAVDAAGADATATISAFIRACGRLRH
jgi:hypothetical protein